MNTLTCKFLAVLLMLNAAVGLSACTLAATPTPPLTPITIQLRWTHQAQFAGFYAADQNGCYAAEGLAVTFVEGGPDVDTLTSVLDGTAQFGVTSAHTLILARAEGKSLRAIAVVYRRSPQIFFALAESGITRPEDFVGKAIRVTPRSAVILRMMTARIGIRPDQYTERYVASLEPFYSGKVQVSSGFVINEVLTAQKTGYKLNLIYPDDYGVHFYGDTIFTADGLIAADPELVTRFLRATLKGWTYAVENPVAIGSMVLKYDPDADVEHETTTITASIPLVNISEDHIGWMKPEMWAGMERTLREQGVLADSVDVTQLYTLQFLHQIHGRSSQ